MAQGLDAARERAGIGKAAVELWPVLASAVLAAAAQSVSGVGWLIVPALLPLVSSLDGAGFFKAWLRMAVFYSCYSLLTLAWIRHAGPGAVWLLPLAALYSLPFLALPAGCVRLFGVASLPAAWALTELAARHVWFGLTWTILGQPLADYPLFAQVAALAGPEVMSFLALGVAVAIHRAFRGEKRTARAAATAAAVVLLWSGWRLSGEELNVEGALAFVQPVNSQKLVWTPASRKPVLENMNRLIDEAGAIEPQMIVLPEMSIPSLVRYDAELTKFVREAVIRTRTTLLFGSLDYEAGQFSNAAILISPNRPVVTHRKVRLLPFVEYTPRWLPWTAPKEWPRLTPGTELTRFSEPEVPLFGVVIGQEDTLPDLARRYAKTGIAGLISLVNTERFLGTAQPLQHVRRARLTSIATGLSMARVTNSGITCGIDRVGKLLFRTAEGRAATGPIGLTQSEPTLYRGYGDAGAAAIFILLGVLAARRGRAAPTTR